PASSHRPTPAQRRRVAPRPGIAWGDDTARYTRCAMSWDVAVVGAGVIGLACAERLARAGLSTLVLERHARFGQETSSRNSQVVHAGMYYPTASLKAELCVRGNASLMKWCET